MQELFSSLMATVKSEFSNADIEKNQVKNEPAISVSWKTLDDPLRPSKRFQPVIIKLHEDFATSELAKRSFSEINKEFTEFIRNKRSQFKPRTTSKPDEPHTADYWIFPPEC